jgi:type IV secretory pathway VirB4 component
MNLKMSGEFTDELYYIEKMNSRGEEMKISHIYHKRFVLAEKFVNAIYEGIGPIDQNTHRTLKDIEKKLDGSETEHNNEDIISSLNYLDQRNKTAVQDVRQFHEDKVAEAKGRLRSFNERMLFFTRCNCESCRCEDNLTHETQY